MFLTVYFGQGNRHVGSSNLVRGLLLPVSISWHVSSLSWLKVKKNSNNHLFMYIGSKRVVISLHQGFKFFLKSSHQI